MSVSRSAAENNLLFAMLINSLFPGEIDFFLSVSAEEAVILGFKAPHDAAQHAVNEKLHQLFQDFIQAAQIDSTHPVALPASVKFKESDISALIKLITDYTAEFKEKLAVHFAVLVQHQEFLYWQTQCLSVLKNALKTNAEIPAVYSGLKKTLYEKFIQISLSPDKAILAKEIYDNLPANMQTAMIEHQKSQCQDDVNSATKQKFKNSKSVTFNFFKSNTKVIDRVVDREAAFETIYQQKAQDFYAEEKRFIDKLSNGEPVNYENCYKNLIQLAERAADIAPNENVANWRACVTKYQTLLKQECPEEPSPTNKKR